MPHLNTDSVTLKAIRIISTPPWWGAHQYISVGKSKARVEPSWFFCQRGKHNTSAIKNASNRGDPSETKFDAKISTSKSYQPSRLFRREVIWTQCFHWPNLTTGGGKYPCACVTPERYFLFIFCSANASISSRIKKGKILILILVLALCVNTVFTVKWELLCFRLCGVASEN